MEILLLCMTAFFIARFADKRSAAITVAHCVLFIVLLALSVFTTDIAAVQTVMAHICGAGNYSFVREMLYTPCIWVYSANAVVYFVEFVMLLIVTISATIHAAKKILKRIKSFVRKSKQERRSYISPVRFRAEGNSIFLKYCRILD